MKLCEGCIKQDMCKFKEEVEKYELKMQLPEPLEPIIECIYKETEPRDFYYSHGTPCRTIIGSWTIGNDLFRTVSS